eukprot:gene12653-2313_t
MAIVLFAGLMCLIAFSTYSGGTPACRLAPAFTLCGFRSAHSARDCLSSPTGSLVTVHSLSEHGEAPTFGPLDRVDLSEPGNPMLRRSPSSTSISSKASSHPDASTPKTRMVPLDGQATPTGSSTPSLLTPKSSFSSSPSSGVRLPGLSRRGSGPAPTGAGPAVSSPSSVSPSWASMQPSSADAAKRGPKGGVIYFYDTPAAQPDLTDPVAVAEHKLKSEQKAARYAAMLQKHIGKQQPGKASPGPSDSPQDPALSKVYNTPQGRHNRALAAVHRDQVLCTKIFGTEIKNVKSDLVQCLVSDQDTPPYKKLQANSPRSRFYGTHLVHEPALLEAGMFGYSPNLSSVFMDWKVTFAGNSTISDDIFAPYDMIGSEQFDKRQRVSYVEALDFVLNQALKGQYGEDVFWRTGFAAPTLTIDVVKTREKPVRKLTKPLTLVLQKVFDHSVQHQEIGFTLD